jgi:hypothetical protein
MAFAVLPALTAAIPSLSGLAAAGTPINSSPVMSSTRRITDGMAWVGLDTRSKTLVQKSVDLTV